MTNSELTTDQRNSAEILVKSLGAKATVFSFVEATSKTPGLEQFRVKVGAFSLSVDSGDLRASAEPMFPEGSYMVAI